MEPGTGVPERPVNVQRPDWITPVTEPLDPAVAVNDYDSFAEEYAAENENSLLNAYIERPAMLDLAGDVSGRRILDAGCGSGALTARLRERGAIVTGIDASAGMLAVARRRLGDDADLRVADLREPLPFGDDEFDDVIASLVLHYLEDWGPTLAELRRVIKPGGRLIASVNHPFVEWLSEDPRPVYRDTTSYTDLWTFGGKQYPLTFWRRPLHAMTGAFTDAGFRLSAISEPKTAPDAPEPFDGISFMCFVVEVPQSAA
ncbi:class I SAM-dependent methyltransferase [Nonomuraea sp. FMUSA5-5]|uniref:Class I SAM-dependent methyltransferase n=1 Tax=Nonomuraea composti TaxID=2720023 RepID=A0ABX1B5Z6_9ACTN|nr:class I SAM-dependent methyltransferase [Nonomuraea sp. FMUSA5-5]NJP92891.1 class I SAM-dependent methyltransferase [Nonomuraea sp. FMUSA5-5]